MASHLAEEFVEQEVGQYDSCEDADPGDPFELEEEPGEDFQHLKEDSLSREPLRAEAFGRRSRLRMGKRQSRRGAQKPLKKNQRRAAKKQYAQREG